MYRPVKHQGERCIDPGAAGGDIKDILKKMHLFLIFPSLFLIPILFFFLFGMHRLL